MFYSQCLISRKGLLKPIWVAAYCHKKLKKAQVAETDIPSSIDEIMQHELTITYRVLGYLLLGVVRIYSKKVEYLYHDCNEVLIHINTSVPPKLQHKEGMCAPYSSITLPERFELDGFVLELPEDMSSEHMANHQLITLEERKEEFVNEYLLLDNYCFYHGEDPARFETSTGVHTPVREALSPHAMDIVIDMGASHGLRSEASMENLQDIQLFGGEFPDFGANCGANQTVELEPQVNEVDREPKRLKFLEIAPPDPGKTGFPSEVDPQANADDRSPRANSVTYDAGAGTAELVAVSTPGKKEQPRFSRKRKRLYDDTIVLSNEVMRQNLHDSSGLLANWGEAPVAALDVWKRYKLPQLYQDFLEPLIPCAQELKTLFKRSVGAHRLLEALGGHIVVGEDQHTILAKPREERVRSAEASEAVIRPAEDDETRNEPSQDRDYSLVPSEGPIRSDNHQSETRREPSQEGTCSLGDREDYSTWNSVERPTTSILDVGVTSSSVPREDGDQIEIDAQNVRLDLTDEEARQEDLSGDQNGWSVRTSALASFLRKSFVNLDPNSAQVVNVAPLLKGRRRKENARTFYEILVLKSGGFVDLKQDTPYGDIFLFSTPQLMSTF